MLINPQYFVEFIPRILYVRPIIRVALKQSGLWVLIWMRTLCPQIGETSSL